MTRTLTRRGFLKQGALATTALALTPIDLLAADSTQVARKGAAKRVIVIGAGLAGLSAAYELVQAGHDVTILEARSRAGGRCHTIREPFAEGLYAEAGATRIPEDHDLTLKYVKLFGLELDDFRPLDLKDVTHINGKRLVVEHGQPTEWPVELTPEEKKLGASGLRLKYITPYLDRMGDVLSSSWVPPNDVMEFDDMTWSEFLQKQGASPGAIKILTLGHSGGMRDEVSALQMLRVSAQSRGRRQMYKVRGGNDQIPQGFATRLAGRIRYNSPVVRLEQNDKQVRVTFLDSGKQQTIEGDQILSAIPFTLLRKIDVSPSFSPDKKRAIDHLWYTSIARIYSQSKTRHWLNEGASGFARTDLPIMETWCLSHNLGGTRGILLAYFSGEPARRATAMKDDERIAFALEHMEKLYPGTRAQHELGTSVCWDAEEWSRGAWAWLTPGQGKSILPHIARSEGRVHFAGDHTSALSSWMQGALESGSRAAREINGA